MTNMLIMRIFALIVLLMTISNDRLFSCTCNEKKTVLEEFSNANIVIFGTVLKKEIVNLKETMNPNRLNEIKDSIPVDRINLLDGPIVTKVTILIDKKFKCEFQSDTAIIYTARMGSACGFLDFEIGKQFIIYAFNKF